MKTMKQSGWAVGRYFAFSSLKQRGEETAVGVVLTPATAAMCYGGHVPASLDKTSETTALL